MKDISIISPVKKPEDIEYFVNNTKCKHFYVYYHKFLDNFEYINKFIEEAKKNNAKIYINFKHNLSEDDLPKIKRMVKFLKKTQIDGIFINNFAILEAIKVFSLPFKVIIDSYFDIHNLSGIDFINTFHKVDGVIITEEIYMKNIAKIKKYTKIPLAIDSDNLPWCAEDIKKLKAIDYVVIKGKFNSSEEILEGIELIEKILESPKMFKNQKLPFKHVRKSIYQTNHFSGEIISSQGKDFKFSKNIQKFDWNIKQSRLKKSINYQKPDFKINLRLSSLSHLKALKKFNQKIGFNMVHSIEYGEIVSTADLSKKSFSEVIKEAKTFCVSNNIHFQLSTPRILIERDFDRVYEYVKSLCLEEPSANSLIINNIGYFWAIINDNDFSKIPLEIGQGINLLNSLSIKCLNNLHSIYSIDFTGFNELPQTLKNLKYIIKNRKHTIAGNIRVPSLGLCPLNNDSAVVSRLSCKAPCHKGEFAIKDPSLKKILPFTVDGFCRMHLFEDSICQNYQDIQPLLDMGINEFVLDFTALPAKFIPILLTNLLNYLYS